MASGRKYLMVQFSDGKSYHGSFDLYEDRYTKPSYTRSSTLDLMYSIEGCSHIQPSGSQFIYTTSSIVKFCDMTEDEYKSYTRDQKIEEII